MANKWLTLDELADYLQMSRTKLYQLARQNRIPASKIGSQWRFDRETIDQWVADSRQHRSYVHGYSPDENARLYDQAQTLVELLHHDTLFEPGSRVLEAGCGVGAQTITLAGKNPQSQLVSIDISKSSLGQAEQTIRHAGLINVQFQQADIFNLPFLESDFDHVFLCFVLEHLPEPEKALQHLIHVLKPGGTITMIEGDHGSTFFYPESDYARRAIQALVDLQASSGGNALIGRELFPMLTRLGLKQVRVSPRMVYVDNSKPQLVDGFTRKTFSAMIANVRREVLEHNLMSAEDFDRGVTDLYRTSEEDGVFCYTFFKASGLKG